MKKMNFEDFSKSISEMELNSKFRMLRLTDSGTDSINFETPLKGVVTYNLPDDREVRMIQSKEDMLKAWADIQEYGIPFGDSEGKTHDVLALIWGVKELPLFFCDAETGKSEIVESAENYDNRNGEFSIFVEDYEEICKRSAEIGEN